MLLGTLHAAYCPEFTVMYSAKFLFPLSLSSMDTFLCIACSLCPPEYWGWWLLQPGWRLCLYVCQFLWSPQEQQWHFHGRKGSRVCPEWQKASYIFVVTMMAWYNVNEATGYMHMQYVFVNTIILLPLSLFLLLPPSPVSLSDTVDLTSEQRMTESDIR